MKLIAISDTHGRHKDLKLPQGDMLIHAGDISMKGEETEVADFLTWFSKQKHPFKILIAGNHDFYFERAPACEIEKIIPENVIYLNDSGVKINDINIWGSPITPWFFNWAFNRHTGQPIKAHWDLIPSDTKILITHGPALGILDTTKKGEHTGCEDLSQKINQIKPAVHICGHIHEAYGVVDIYGTMFINASILNEKYELENEPVVFDL